MNLKTGEMNFISRGEFYMGTSLPEAAEREKPCHIVYVNDYYMDVFMVTNEQFAQFCNETKYKTTAEKIGEGDTFINGKWGWVKGANWRHPYGPESSIDDRHDHPVVLVTVRDAFAYCAWRSRKEKLHFRIPTEAEWEKAARGTDDRRYPWGNDAVDAGGILRARYRDSEPKGTSPVGSFSAGASPYGIMDMAGNAWDWCLDAMDYQYYSKAPRYDVGGPLSISDDNVFRGGSHLFPQEALSATTRHSNNLARPSVGIGFRTVVSLNNPYSIKIKIFSRYLVSYISRIRNRFGNFSKLILKQKY